MSEAEIPTSILAPYSTVQQKLHACSSLDEVSALQKTLLELIDQQRKAKIVAIQNQAIKAIEDKIKEGGEKELGLNENFIEMIRGMVDPDQIDRKKTLILNLLAEQIQEKKDNFENKPTSETPTSLIQNLVVGSVLIMVGLLVIISLIKVTCKSKKTKLNQKNN